MRHGQCLDYGEWEEDGGQEKRSKIVWRKK